MLGLGCQQQWWDGTFVFALETRPNHALLYCMLRVGCSRSNHRLFLSLAELVRLENLFFFSIFLKLVGPVDEQLIGWCLPNDSVSVGRNYEM